MLLSARGALIQDQMVGYGESGCRSRNGHHELSSGCHRLLLLHCPDLRVRRPSSIFY